jgi:L-rhamnose mutarotase
MAQRMGFCLGLKPEHIAEYKRLHAAVWPDILRQITASHIRNYTIFLREPENILFAYWEYAGLDFAADMAAMAADPMTQKWWEVCMPLQAPLPSRGQDEWWAGMEEVFHLD